MSHQTSSAVERAVAAFRNGDPVLVHDFDDREGETDILYPSSAITPQAVARLRNDGGGLLFVAFSHQVAETLDLPFLHEVIDHPANDHTDLGYDAHPSFSLTVNHRETYTGVTDDDRALTMRTLGEVASGIERGMDYGADDFAAEFRMPGHVHLLKAAPGLLRDRQGHTELGLALAEVADLPPAVAGCEMLDDENGGALSKADARSYARRHGLEFIDGTDLVSELR